MDDKKAEIVLPAEIDQFLDMLSLTMDNEAQWAMFMNMLAMRRKALDAKAKA